MPWSTRHLRPLLVLVALPLGACSCDEGSLVDARGRLELDPLMVDFGRVPVGDFRVRGLVLKNKGQTPITFEKFELRAPTTEMKVATPIPERLAPEQVLDFNLVFEPTDVGEDRAEIIIVTDDGSGERVVPLKGVGVDAAVGVILDGPTCAEGEGTLSFGNVIPGQTAERTITLKATGDFKVNILAAVPEPGSSTEFTLDASVLPKELAPDEQVVLTARYSPVDGGPDRTIFMITTDDPSRPSIRIAACGLGAAPAICATPVPLDFGPVAVGQSVTKTLKLESCGIEPVDVTAVALANDAQHPTDSGFTLVTVPSLPQTLQPQQTVDVAVQFQATALANATGYVEVTSTAFNRPQSYFPLTARGAQPCGLEVIPAQVTYSGVPAGSTMRKSVLVSNNGASQCDVTRVEIAAGTSIFNLPTPPSTPLHIGPGQSEIIEIEYAPTGAGPDMGTLEVEEGGVAHAVALVGNPTVDDGCHVDVAPTFLNFGGVPLNTARSMGVVLTNISDDPCFLRGVELDPASHPDFTETSQNFGLILPGASKTLSATYTPTSQGSASGTMIIETNDVSTPIIRVPLFGASGETGICVVPRTLDFGPTMSTASLSFTISACGAATVTVNALDWTTPDPEFSILSAPALPFVLAPGASQTVTVQYASLDMQGDTGVLTVRSDDFVEPAVDVTVTGGPQIVPPSAGRYLYYWQIPSVVGGDVMRLPLQGATVADPFWGPRNGKPCAGCHSVSPDGKYVAVVEQGFLRIVETRSNIALTLPDQPTSVAFFTWKPNVASTPPYQYAYDDGQDIQISSLFSGHLRTLQGANDPNFLETMPSWGPNGQIAFARGTAAAGGNGGNFGLQGTVDSFVVPETGGTAVPLLGASNNNGANYYPTISPNGEWIAFTYSASAQSTIAATDAVLKLAKADNSGTILDLPVLNSAANDGASSYPTWSVDGAFLSFSSNRAGGRGDWDIYIAPVDPITGADGPAVNVTDANTPAFEHSAQWSP